MFTRRLDLSAPATGRGWCPLVARRMVQVCAAAGAVAWILAGCTSTGGSPPPKEASKLDLAVVANADVNPDEKMRASPIQVVVYELKTESAFESADYFSLHDTDKAVLQGDLLVKTEYLLRPGDSKVIQRKTHPETTALGVLAGYRELARSRWRTVYKLPEAPEATWWRMAIPAQKIKLKISLEDQGIRITEVQ